MKKRRGRLLWTNDEQDHVHFVDDEKGEWVLTYMPVKNEVRESKGCMYYAVVFVLLVVLLIIL